MPLKKQQIVQVEIDKLAFGGAGVGKCVTPEEPAANGMVTFVPNTIPGDSIQAALTKIKKNHLEGQLHKILVPSPLRIEPRCKHFGVCGGCTWQNLDYEKQVEFKTTTVKETLVHLGGFTVEEVDAFVCPMLACPSPWYYRNKMELSFDQPSEGSLELGFHLPKRRHEVFQLEECFLQSERLPKIVKQVRDFSNAHGLSVFRDRTASGLLRNLIIREGKNTGELMINLVTSHEDFPQKDAFKTHFTTGEWEGQVTSLIWTQIHQARGYRTRRANTLLAGRETITEEMTLENGKTLRFDISPESFFQPNTHQAERLYATVVEMAQLKGTETVYDLFCGTGTIGLFCANKAQQVYGIELIPDAVENAKKNALRNEIENVQFFVGDVGELLTKKAPEGSASPDVVIVDPPRAGLEGIVPEQVAQLGAATIIYVSCNPTTLARDLKLFGMFDYKVEAVQPVDMFPQTYHIENVVRLVKG